MEVPKFLLKIRGTQHKQIEVPVTAIPFPFPELYVINMLFFMLQDILVSEEHLETPLLKAPSTGYEQELNSETSMSILPAAPKWCQNMI